MSDSWIEWIHEGSAIATTNALKLVNIALGALPLVRHCATCMNVSGCYFLESKMPKQPLHENCHCYFKSIPNLIPGKTAKAECAMEKITNYAFADFAKKRFFESNGYDITDARLMQENFEWQGMMKYAEGSYQLGKLDKHGQRITIFVELPRRIDIDSEPLRFETGWLVYPFGNIKLTTPATNLSSK